MKIVNVFVDNQGRFGNPVGIIVDEQKLIPQDQRQILCIESGFSEIVFINNITKCQISIFSPTGEIPFAGHAVLGTVYYLNSINGKKINELISGGQKINISYDIEKIWVKARLDTLPNWNFKEYNSVDDINKLTLADTKEFEHCYVWAWEDEENNIIRARTFALDWDIPEDEANGSGSMLLAANLKRNLIVYHGKGSVIYANFLNSDFGEIGGYVKAKLISYKVKLIS